MKKIFFVTVVAFAMFACNQPKQQTESTQTTDSTASKGSDMMAMYQKNLATLQSGITAFENENIDAWAATVADTAVWQSPAYGDTVTTKAHWKEALAMYIANWDSLKLMNPIYLPGIDQKTQQPDGSVRYYGQWTGVHKSGKRTSINFYGTYDFNTDGQVVQGGEFWDVGGLMKAVGAK